MKVMYWIDNNTNITFDITFEYNNQEYVISQNNQYIGQFLSFILNSNTPLYDLALKEYSEEAIYKFFSDANIILDIKDKKISIDDIKNRDIYSVCNDVLEYGELYEEYHKEIYSEECINQDFIILANDLFESEKKYKNIRNNFINIKSFNGIDLNDNEKNNIKKIVTSVLLSSDDNYNTVPMRLDSFLKTNSKNESSNILKYTCETRLDVYSFSMQLVTGSTFSSFYDFLIFLLIHMIKNNITIKKCRNCNRYFYSERRSDAIFCNEISPQDSSKTCKEYGQYITYQGKIKNNPAMLLHKQIYNTLRNQYTRCKTDTNQKKLTEFMNQSDRFKNDVKHNLKTEREYIEWLESIKANGEVPNGND